MVVKDYWFDSFYFSVFVVPSVFGSPGLLLFSGYNACKMFYRVNMS